MHRNRILNSRITACLIIFYVCEFVEMVIIFMGTTIFLNKLSIVQIFLHSVTILLLAWFIWLRQDFTGLWGIWAVGG
jgi:hypothetical protein